MAVVNPSQLESLSLVLMEAWLEGTPCLVAAGVRGDARALRTLGRRIPFDSYESFRDALDRLLADDELRTRMGEAGRAYVLETYGWPRVRERFQRTVESLVA